MKLNLKEIDYKQFLLEKGERVGVGVAVALMVLLIVFGLLWPSHGFFSGSPVEKAGELDKASKSIEDGLRNPNNKPGPNDAPPANANEKLIDLDTNPLKAQEFALAGGLFLGHQADKPTRRMPGVKQAEEGAVAFAWANIDTYVPVFDRDSGNITGVYFLKGFAKGGGAGMPGAMPGLPGAMPGPMGGMAGGRAGMGMGGGRPGMGMPGGINPLVAGGAGVRLQAPEERKVFVLEPVLFAEMSKKSGTPARQLRPRRMAIIAASFPYKNQLEEFKDKLHLSSIQEVLQEQVKEVVKDPATDKWVATGKMAPAFRFLGVKVQRRTLDAAGGTLENWADIDLGAEYRPWLVYTGKRFEPEKPKYVPISFPGLIMRPLLQFRENPESAGPDAPPDEFENKYPEVEGRLTKIQETLKALQEVKDPGEIARPPAAFDPSGFDAFNTSQAAPEAGQRGTGPDMAVGPGKPMSVNPMPGGGAGATAAKQTVPEYCLIRLIDLTIDPGKTYQYRIKVRMANPNYERPDVADPTWARDEELVAKEWYEIPEKVSVPPELMYYAIDQKDVDEAEGKKYTGPDPRDQHERDRTIVLQIHRWLGAARIRSMGSREPFLIGEWAVAERVRIYRGEYADRPVRVELPVWSAPHNDFLLPVDPVGRKSKVRGFEVDFGHDEDKQTVLVDFEGGQLTYNRPAPTNEDETKAKPRVDDAYATEVLLMTPEGKLLGHDSATDSADPQRIHQREVSIRRVLHVLTKTNKSNPAPAGNPFGNNPPGPFGPKP